MSNTATFADNPKRKPGFTQVYVWPGTLLPESDISKFIDWLSSQFGVRGQYLETIVTLPRDEDGPESGGRHDVFFSVHDDDLPQFSVPRLEWGIFHVESIFLNLGHKAYPERIKGYASWPDVVEMVKHHDSNWELAYGVVNELRSVIKDLREFSDD